MLEPVVVPDESRIRREIELLNRIGVYVRRGDGGFCRAFVLWRATSLPLGSTGTGDVYMVSSQACGFGFVEIENLYLISKDGEYESVSAFLPIERLENYASS